MKLRRLLLLVNGLAFVATGLYGLLAHQNFATFIGFQLTSPAAQTEFLANYGGLYLFYGLFLTLGAVKTNLTASGVIALLLTSLGLALGRLTGFLLTGHIEPNQLIFASWELASALLCLIALKMAREG